MEPIKITQEMKDTKRKRIDELIERTNNSIKVAMKYGWNSACFYPMKDDPYYEDVRRIFENAGYKIKPTGIIGGVVQTTEDICW